MASDTRNREAHHANSRPSASRPVSTSGTVAVWRVQLVHWDPVSTSGDGPALPGMRQSDAGDVCSTAEHIWLRVWRSLRPPEPSFLALRDERQSADFTSVQT